jgi:hypothetical protein
MRTAEFRTEEGRGEGNSLGTQIRDRAPGEEDRSGKVTKCRSGKVRSTNSHAIMAIDLDSIFTFNFRAIASLSQPISSSCGRLSAEGVANVSSELMARPEVSDRLETSLASKGTHMPETRFSKMYLCSSYINENGTKCVLPPLIPGGEPNFGLPEMPIIVEPSFMPDGTRITPRTSLQLEQHKLAIDAYVTTTGDDKGPILLNTEKYGASAGGFPWQDNVQAAGELARYAKQASKYPLMKIGAYAPAPRSDFFQAAGDVGTAIVPQSATLYVDQLRATIKYLKAFCDIMVIGAYVPWRGPMALADQINLFEYLRNHLNEINEYHYGRYVPASDDRSVFSPGFGVADWKECFKKLLEIQFDAIRAEAPNHEIHVYTSMSWLPNGWQYNPRTEQPAGNNWMPPVWQVLMREATAREILRFIRDQVPNALVLLEGWSDEKQSVYDAFTPVNQPPLTLPLTDPPTAQYSPGSRWGSASGRGALLWKEHIGTSDIFPVTRHPYLEAIIRDFAPL